MIRDSFFELLEHDFLLSHRSLSRAVQLTCKIVQFENSKNMMCDGSELELYL